MALPEEWLEPVRADPRIDAPTLEELGATLAGLIGRARPFGRTTVHRFLSGETTTIAMTQAVCLLLDRPMPVAVARYDAEARWFIAGEAFRDVAEERFLRWLEDVEKVVGAERRKREDLGSDGESG